MAKISPADDMVTKHKKPQISISTSTNPECGWYDDGFKVQWEVNEKGDWFLSVLIPKHISRALREGDVDCICYIANIWLLKKKKPKIPKLLFPREMQSAKEFASMSVAHIGNKFKIWKKLHFSCMHCALVEIQSTYIYTENSWCWRFSQMREQVQFMKKKNVNPVENQN